MLMMHLVVDLNRNTTLPVEGEEDTQPIVINMVL
jgi:hypothetical protein